MKLFALFFLFCSLFAETTQILSDEANFNGDELTLSSNVEVKHDLGIIFSDEARLKGDPLSEFHLSGNVNLFSKRGGKLFCDQASFFQQEKFATFSSEKTLNYSQEDFEISCQRAESRFGKNMDLFKHLSLVEIEELQFIKDAEIQYADGTASGGKAILKNIVGQDDIPVQGSLVLYPQAPTFLCRLNHYKDQIFASLITIDFSRSEITAKYSKGTLYLPLVGKEFLHQFSCDHLFIKKDLGEMILKGNVHIEAPDGLEMISDRMIITAAENTYTITALGKSIFYFPKGPSLTCSGVVYWNNTHQKIEVLSEKEPVIFQDEQVTLLARQGTVLYDQGSEIEFQKIEFDKDVKIMTTGLQNKMSYGLADKVIYCPPTKQCTLSSNEGNHVFFWNEEDSIHLTASEIYIKEDPNDHSHQVQGKGKVRFTFDPQGKDVLKKFLSKYFERK